MAQFRTTADLVDIVLRKGGELTDGTSQYEVDVLESINTVHQTIINGGNEFGVDMDEAWPWAKAPEPIILELEPAVDTGSVSVTLGSEDGTFSSAPAASMEGRFLKVETLDDYFKIVQHAAGAAAFQLDSNYTGDTNATANFKAIRLDYKLEAQKVVINSENNKLDFEETAATELTATLTNGAYTPDELATEIQTKINALAASAFTVSYDEQSAKFTITSDSIGDDLVTLSYSQDDTGAAVVVDNATDGYAQSFTATQSGTGMRVQLPLIKVGSPTGNIRFEIQADSSGEPDGTTIGLGLLDVSTIPLTLTTTSVTLSTPATGLVSGTLYHIVALPDDLTLVDGSNFYRVGINTSGTYAGGKAIQRTVGTWAEISSTTDSSFEVDIQGTGGGALNLLAQSGTNFAQSGYQTIGFDIENQTGLLTYTSTYRRNGIVRLYEPVTAYQMVSEEGNIYSLPEVEFKKEFPFTQIRERTPSHYTITKHTEDGSMTIRFNGYPADPTRVELDFIEVPVDLKDNAQSLPLLPRSYIQILIYGGLFYLLTEKEDDKAQQYFQLAATKLKALVKQGKRNQLRAGKFFGSTISRREQVDGFRHRRRWSSNGDLQG